MVKTTTMIIVVKGNTVLMVIIRRVIMLMMLVLHHWYCINTSNWKTLGHHPRYKVNPFQRVPDFLKTDYMKKNFILADRYENSSDYMTYYNFSPA